MNLAYQQFAPLLFLAMALGTGIIVFFLLYISYKIWRVHLMSYEIRDGLQKKIDCVYSQLEALAALILELKLEQGLPPTRGTCASPDFLLLIARHTLNVRPAIIVECGSGTSTVVIARALELNGAGHLYSLEHEPAFAAATRDHLKRLGLEHRATVLDAPLRLYNFGSQSFQWYTSDAIPTEQIDMLVIDGPPLTIGPMARYPAGPILFPLLEQSAMVFVDDASRDDEKNTAERWLKEFPNFERRAHLCEKGCIALSIKTLSRT